MRLAHLVLTHTNPDQLNRLTGALAYEDADFYVHVDLKTDIGPFREAVKGRNVFFVNNRVKVNWAGYSIVQATVNGFEQLLASAKPYDHVNLLSGQDYPIKSAAEIHRFLADNRGKLFMHTLSVQDEWQEAIPRITEYHLPDVDFPGKHKALGMINKLAPRRRMPFSLTAVGRSQWFTIPLPCVAYIVNYLRQHPAVPRFFRMSWAPDEMIFQTILYNSLYRKDMVNDNMVYVDWSAGGASPKILTIADAEALDNSDKLFARKFNPLIDTGILDYLDKKNNNT